jgi:hypothetical protein
VFAGPLNALQLDDLPERALTLVLFYVGPIDRIRLERVNKRWLEAAAKAWVQCHHLHLSEGPELGPHQSNIKLRAILHRSGPHLHSLSLAGAKNRLLDEKTISDIGTFCPNLSQVILTLDEAQSMLHAPASRLSSWTCPGLHFPLKHCGP